MEEFEKEDFERQLEEVQAQAKKEVAAECLRKTIILGPPVLALVGGLAAFQLIDLHSPNFKYTYVLLGGGALWLAWAVWLSSYLDRKRTAGECGLRAGWFSAWLTGEADGLPFRVKISGYEQRGEDSFGIAMEMEMPLSNTAAPLVLYRRLVRQDVPHLGAPLELPAWLGKFKMGAYGEAPGGVMAVLGEENVLAPLFHPEGGLRLLKTDGRMLRAEFLRGAPYVLPEPGELAALAARLARAF